MSENGKATSAVQPSSGEGGGVRRSPLFRCRACGELWRLEELLGGRCGDACCGAAVDPLTPPEYIGTCAISMPSGSQVVSNSYRFTPGQPCASVIECAPTPHPFASGEKQPPCECAMRLLQLISGSIGLTNHSEFQQTVLRWWNAVRPELEKSIAPCTCDELRAELHRFRDEEALLAAANHSTRIGVHNLRTLMDLLTREHHLALPGNEGTVDAQGMIHEMAGQIASLRVKVGRLESAMNPQDAMDALAPKAGE